MGFRFRKSVRLPGGLRFNFSKRGVGASWGFKGFRVTKSPGRKMKTTHSIPGTGISYVSGGGEKSRKSSSSRSSSASRSSGISQPSASGSFRSPSPPSPTPPRNRPQDKNPTPGIIAYSFEFICAVCVPYGIADGEPGLSIFMGVLGVICGFIGFRFLRKKDDKNV